nr:phosphomethylpyrimidine synthase ThiC [Keratinibaculum paraultunense]
MPGAKDWDYDMSKARRKLDWEKMFELAIDKEKAIKYREESTPELHDSCTMCGKMCSVRNMNRVMEGKDVSILKE